jgi:hypothetical protein
MGFKGWFQVVMVPLAKGKPSLPESYMYAHRWLAAGKFGSHHQLT